MGEMMTVMDITNTVNLLEKACFENGTNLAQRVIIMKKALDKQ